MAFSAIYDLVIDERDIRIYSNGTGAPVLMLPDLGSSAATWECLTGAVCEQDRQIVAVDLPGTGHCDPVRGSDLAAFVEHLQRVVEHLGNDPDRSGGLRLRRLSGRQRCRKGPAAGPPAGAGEPVTAASLRPTGAAAGWHRRWRSAGP